MRAFVFFVLWLLLQGCATSSRTPASKEIWTQKGSNFCSSALRLMAQQTKPPSKSFVDPSTSYFDARPHATLAMLNHLSELMDAEVKKELEDFIQLYTRVLSENKTDKEFVRLLTKIDSRQAEAIDKMGSDKEFTDFVEILEAEIVALQRSKEAGMKMLVAAPAPKATVLFLGALDKEGFNVSLYPDTGVGELFARLKQEERERSINSVDSQTLKRLETVINYLRLSRTDPHLQTHEIDKLSDQYDRQIFEVYFEKVRSKARRLFYCRGPQKNQIILLELIPHPENLMKAYEHPLAGDKDIVRRFCAP